MSNARKLNPDGADDANDTGTAIVAYDKIAYAPSSFLHRLSVTQVSADYLLNAPCRARFYPIKQPAEKSLGHDQGQPRGCTSFNRLPRAQYPGQPPRDENGVAIPTSPSSQQAGALLTRIAPYVPGDANPEALGPVPHEFNLVIHAGMFNAATTLRLCTELARFSPGDYRLKVVASYDRNDLINAALYLRVTLNGHDPFAGFKELRDSGEYRRSTTAFKSFAKAFVPFAEGSALIKQLPVFSLIPAAVLSHSSDCCEYRLIKPGTDAVPLKLRFGAKSTSPNPPAPIASLQKDKLLEKLRRKGSKLYQAHLAAPDKKLKTEDLGVLKNVVYVFELAEDVRTLLGHLTAPDHTNVPFQFLHEHAELAVEEIAKCLEGVKNPDLDTLWIEQIGSAIEDYRQIFEYLLRHGASCVPVEWQDGTSLRTRTSIKRSIEAGLIGQSGINHSLLELARRNDMVGFNSWATSREIFLEAAYDVNRAAVEGRLVNPKLTVSLSSQKKEIDQIRQNYVRKPYQGPIGTVIEEDELLKMTLACITLPGITARYPFGPGTLLSGVDHEFSHNFRVLFLAQLVNHESTFFRFAAQHLECLPRADQVFEQLEGGGVDVLSSDFIRFASALEDFADGPFREYVCGLSEAWFFWSRDENEDPASTTVPGVAFPQATRQFLSCYLFAQADSPERQIGVGQGRSSFASVRAQLANTLVGVYGNDWFSRNQGATDFDGAFPEADFDLWWGEIRKMLWDTRGVYESHRKQLHVQLHGEDRMTSLQSTLRLKGPATGTIPTYFARKLERKVRRRLRKSWQLLLLAAKWHCCSDTRSALSKCLDGEAGGFGTVPDAKIELDGSLTVLEAESGKLSHREIRRHCWGSERYARLADSEGAGQAYFQSLRASYR